MASTGILLNVAATGIAAACFAAVGASMARRKTREGHSLAGPLFFGTTALFLALAAARQVAAYAGNEALDLLLFQALLVPAGLAIVPLVHLATELVSGRRRLADAVALLFAGAALVGLVAAYVEGFSGPRVSPWGTEWTIHSALAKGLLILILTVPGIAIGGLLYYTGRRTDGEAARRARLLGVSCAVYYLVFTFDAFGLDGVPLLLARLATAATAVLAYAASLPGGFGRRAGASAGRGLGGLSRR